MNSNKLYQLTGIKVILYITFSFCLSFTLNAADNNTIVDSDGDGLSDQYEERIGTETYLADTDGDGINDGEEIGDNLKNPLNTDGDRYINAIDYDDDNDGLPTILESKADTDRDGLKDYLDTDSDNDNVSDGIEAGMLNKDDNLDLIDDAFDSEQIGAIDKNGDGINDIFKLPDHNKDGIPDYLDAKYTVTDERKLVLNEAASNKPIVKNNIQQKSEKIKQAKKHLEELLRKRKEASLSNKKKETKKTVKNNSRDQNKKIVSKPKKSKSQKSVNITRKTATKKMAINRYTDTDNDGLLDTLERVLGTNPLKRDSDGDKVSDAIEIGMDINAPLDSDHDMIIDALDPDDDNDGILTKNEDVNKDSSPINDDTDDDGVPNYLDANDDGDSRLTREEGGTKDSDNDGILDYLDNNDNIKNTRKLAINKQSIPKKPEVVVLFDGNLESLGNDSSKDYQKEEKVLAEETIDNAIQNASLEEKKESIEESSGIKKKENEGVIAWITSLLPD